MIFTRSSFAILLKTLMVLVAISILFQPVVPALAQETVEQSPVIEALPELPSDNAIVPLSDQESVDPEVPIAPENLEVTPEDEASENPETITKLEDPEEEEKPEPETSVTTQESITPPASSQTVLPPSTVKQALPDADIASGALVYSYPFRTPPGRNNIQPDLSLNYNSQNNEESSLFGFGWSLSLPSIERKNLYGLDKLYESLDFSATGAGDLKYISGTGDALNFGAKFDTAFQKFTFLNQSSGGHWTVQDKFGITYTYGLDQSAKVDDPTDSSKVYRWYLTEVKDASGNFASYEYTKIDGQVYPSKITYTNNGSNLGAFEVKFILEDRPDQPMTSKSGFMVKTAKRIRFIESYALGVLVGKYDLGYVQLPVNNRTQITTLTYSGFAESGEVATERPITFEYASIGATNLLTQITTSQGGSTNIEYKSSVQYRNSEGESQNPNLPFAINTAERISYDDGNGVTWANAFNYFGGWYYFNGPFDRRFAGFEKIIKTNSVGTQSVSYYHQGNGNNAGYGELGDTPAVTGKVYRTEQLGNTGQLYQKSWSKWSAIDLANGRSFPKLIQSLSQSFNGNSTHRDRAQAFTYDDVTGNLLTQTSWGEVLGQDSGSFTDIGGDRLQTTISYASNVALNIIGLPSQTITLDQSNQTVSDSRMYYDQQPLGSVSKGLVTKNEDWISGSTYAITQKTYDAVTGNVLSEIDPRGKITNYLYDAFGLYPATVINPLGHTVRYVYDYSLGKSKQITDQNNFVYQTVYDGLDRIIEEKQPDPNQPTTLLTKTLYEYTPRTTGTRLKKIDFLDANTFVESFVYTDGFERPIQTRQEMESANQFAVTDTVYNSLEQVHKQSVPYISSGSAKTNSTNVSDFYTTYSYDPLSRVIATQNSVGTETKSYDDWVTTIIDPRGKVKRYYNDAKDQLVKVDEINSGNTYSTQYVYNGAGKLIKIIDALGNLRQFNYDALGSRLQAEDLHADSDTTFGIWQYSYDDAGNLIQTTNPNGQIVQYVHDDINRILSENYTGQSGTEVIYTYDNCTSGVGKVCNIISSGTSASYQYNALGLVTNEAKTISGVVYNTQYSYDRQGNIVTLTNPDNSQVKYGFNSAGQVETIQRKENTDANFVNVVTDFDYGPHGVLTFQANHNGTAITNTFDASKQYRLVRKQTSGPGGSSDSAVTVNFYPTSGDGSIYRNNSSNWTTTRSAISGSGVSSTVTTLKVGSGKYSSIRFQIERGFLSFDTSALPDNATITNANLKVFVDSKLNNDNDGTDWVTVVQGNQPSTSSLALADYDLAGSVNNPVEGIDALGRKDITLVATGQTLGFTLNQTGQNWVSKTAPTKLALREGHDVINSPFVGSSGQHNRLVLRAGEYAGTTSDPILEITYTVPSAPSSVAIQDLNYSYDANGNITKVIDASDMASSKTVDYTYDDLNRLVSAVTSGIATGQQNYTESFVYNAIGNLTSKTSGGVTTLYSYSGSGYANPHGATSIGGVTQSYDSAGNLLSDGTWSHSWDYGNRLIQSQKTGTTITYAYDQASSRVKLVTPLKTTVVPSKFYSVEGTEVVKYILAGDSAVVTIRGTGQTATAQWMHSDNLNSSSSVSNLQGQLVQISDFLPFGAVRFEQNYNNFDDRKGYIGKDFDKDTQLSYLEARYYNGTAGRFIGQDKMFWELPVELLVDPQQQNSYSYARNNPINRSDPSGLLTIVVPGTWHSPEGWKNSTFANEVKNTFNDPKFHVFSDTNGWRGGDNDISRSVSAVNLAYFIKNNRDLGEKLNIVAHSHGGNVVADALSFPAFKGDIDNFVTIGTPVRKDYPLNNERVKNHINVYSNLDPVQVFGGGQLNMGKFGLLLGSPFAYSAMKNEGEFGFAKRTYNNDVTSNINATRQSFSPLLPNIHGNLYNRGSIWEKVKPLIRN